MSIPVDVMRGIIGAAVQVIGDDYPIKAPGITGPDAEKYIELVLIQQDNASRTWGQEKLYSGFLRVILHWPIDGAGVYPPSEVLAAIAEQFPKGAEIHHGAARLLIYENPSITDVIEGAGENLYPLTIAYSFFHVPT